MKRGGWGYAEDSLRVLTVAGPVLRIGRMGLAKFAANPNGGVCAWVTAAKALRQTGTRHFATVAELMNAAGHANAPKSMADMIPLLKKLGAVVKDLGDPKSFSEIEKLVAKAPSGVVMFGVTWGKSAHALYAFRDAAGRFHIADRTGVTARTLVELEAKVLSKLGTTYFGIKSAVPQGAAVLVENAAIVAGSTLASVLALEVRLIMLATQPQAEQALSGKQSKTK